MSWLVVIPFKGAPEAKSRLGEAYSDGDRAALALAFLCDTVSAVRATAAVAGVTIVSSEPGLAARFQAREGIAPASALAPVEVVPDPGTGLNAAIAHGIASFRAGNDRAHVAALLGDLPGLTATELEGALAEAERHPLAFVPDREGSGTTMITLAPGVAAEPLFGEGSAAAHAAAGFVSLGVGQDSGLRADVDSPEDLRALPRVGGFTRPLL